MVVHTTSLDGILEHLGGGYAVVGGRDWSVDGSTCRVGADWKDGEGDTRAYGGAIVVVLPTLYYHDRTVWAEPDRINRVLEPTRIALFELGVATLSAVGPDGAPSRPTRMYSTRWAWKCWVF